MISINIKYTQSTATKSLPSQCSGQWSPLCVAWPVRLEVLHGLCGLCTGAGAGAAGQPGGELLHAGLTGGGGPAGQLGQRAPAGRLVVVLPPRRGHQVGRLGLAGAGQAALVQRVDVESGGRELLVRGLGPDPVGRNTDRPVVGSRE